MDEDQKAAEDATWRKWMLGIGGLLAVLIVVGAITSPPRQTGAGQQVEKQSVGGRVDEVAGTTGRDEDVAASGDGQVDIDEERRKGFHCLSAWDGSNRDFVRQVKRVMRNPRSFEHMETSIYPVQDGEHGAWMTFRAENGFGGINVERMYARIDHETCAARVLPNGPGSG